jgi:hypothetical protein
MSMQREGEAVGVLLGDLGGERTRECEWVRREMEAVAKYR